ncbi:MAG: DUF4153 domain-containing protein, partial [Alphaproteobacteria bacterium]|nr:DUF4153 domain-containing protein [Alphaproteobacteria bacterium]
AAFGYFFGSALLASYILIAFLQAGLQEGRLHFRYSRLFVHSWSNVIILVVAGIFVGLSWLILWLWWALFGLIQIDLFEDIFTNAAFAWPFTGVVAGLGIAIARENPKIVPALRRIVLLICQFLSPVLAAASLLFLTALPFTGLSPLWKTGSATALLTSVLFALVLLSNAVIQDGDQEERSPGLLKGLMALSLLVSPVIGELALYAMSLRIAQYGLTPDRFAGLLIVIVAALHAAVYAVGVALRRLEWDRFVFQANRGLALLVAGLALLIATPVLDPFAWSASNQLNRLKDGRADAEAFDYGYLKFRLGASGREALAEIRTWTDHKQQEDLDKRLAQLQTADDYYDWHRIAPRPVQSQPQFTADHFKMIPEPFDLPPDLFEAMQTKAL